MKIASHIKPRSGKPRLVTFNGTKYAFAPTEDKHGITHYVASVGNKDDAKGLVGSGHFYEYSPDMEKPPVLKRDDPPAPPPETFKPEVVEEAHALLENTTDDVSVAIGKVSSLDVIRSAIRLEAAGHARKGVSGLLDTALEAGIAAGVK